MLTVTQTSNNKGLWRVVKNGQHIYIYAHTHIYICIYTHIWKSVRVCITWIGNLYQSIINGKMGWKCSDTVFSSSVLTCFQNPLTTYRNIHWRFRATLSGKIYTVLTSVWNVLHNCLSYLMLSHVVTTITIASLSHCPPMGSHSLPVYTWLSGEGPYC